MGYSRTLGRVRKLRRLKSVFKNAFLFQLRPQLAEHNGHWSGKSYDAGSKKNRTNYLTDSGE